MLQKEEEEYMRKLEEESINEYNKKKEERNGQINEMKRIRENNKNIIYQKVNIIFINQKSNNE